jgi:hypothetical protein
MDKTTAHDLYVHTFDLSELTLARTVEQTIDHVIIKTYRCTVSVWPSGRIEVEPRDE